MIRFYDNPLKQLRAIFKKFDEDADGSLTHMELVKLLRYLGLKLTGDQTRALLRKVDTNGNGAVEFVELVAAIAPVLMEKIMVDKDQLRKVFRSFDRNGSGYITAPELARSMAKMGYPLTFSELMEMMREADVDGDGAISFSEFSSIMTRVLH